MMPYGWRKTYLCSNTLRNPPGRQIAGPSGGRGIQRMGMCRYRTFRNMLEIARRSGFMRAASRSFLNAEVRDFCGIPSGATVSSPKCLLTVMPFFVVSWETTSSRPHGTVGGSTVQKIRQEQDMAAGGGGTTAAPPPAAALPPKKNGRPEALS